MVVRVPARRLPTASLISPCPVFESGRVWKASLPPPLLTGCKVMPQGLCDFQKGLPWRLVRRRYHHWYASVARLANLDKKGHFTQKRDILALRLCPPTAVSKDFCPFARWGGVKTHIFHDAEDGHVDFLKHGDAFAHDTQRRLLRGSYDHAAVQRHRLAQRKLSVAGARWQINQQIIQFTPLNGSDELLDGFDDHRAAPDDRLVAIKQETHAHELDAVI